MPKAIAATATTLLCLALASSGCTGGPTGAQGFPSDASSVQVVSTLVGDKNVFIPSTIAVAAGQPTSLSIYNTTDVAHGFAIPALGIQRVLPPREELEVALPALEGPRLFAIRCHLHTAHRTATLLVHPAGPE